jgi:hypothetical protein
VKCRGKEVFILAENRERNLNNWKTNFRYIAFLIICPPIHLRFFYQKKKKVPRREKWLTSKREVSMPDRDGCHLQDDSEQINQSITSVTRYTCQNSCYFHKQITLLLVLAVLDEDKQIHNLTRTQMLNFWLPSQYRFAPTS